MIKVCQSVASMASAARRVDGAEDVVQYDHGDGDNRQTECNTSRLQPFFRSMNCAVPRSVFSIPLSRPAMFASNKNLRSHATALADVVFQRESGEKRANWPHPAFLLSFR